MMNTQEIVKTLLEYINQGKNVEAEEALYADDVHSYEQNGHSAHGKEAIIAKTKAARDNVEQMHGGGVTETFVGADSFLLKFEIDATWKGGSRMQMTEYGFYKVKDGKISEEYFFSERMPA